MVKGNDSMVHLNIVNKLPIDVMKIINQILEISTNDGYFFHEKISILSDDYSILGRGACGCVFNVSGYAVKLNQDEGRDGRVLHELEGLPFIPKVYLYDDENSIIVTDIVDGLTIKDYKNGKGDFPLSFKKLDEQFEKIEQFIKDSANIGYLPNDLHFENIMIDKLSNVWIVDVGLFMEDFEFGIQSRYPTKEMRIAFDSLLSYVIMKEKVKI